MATVSRVTRAVGAIFPNEGLSLWHSIGEAAFQEVPHLHIHIHPRFHDDEVLRVYPNSPATPKKQKRDVYASNLRHFLANYEEGPNQARGGVISPAPTNPTHEDGDEVVFIEFERVSMAGFDLCCRV